MKKKLEEILNQFNISANITETYRISGGLINETYFAATDRGEYIVQKINTEVFDDPEGIMRNIDFITSHIRDKELDHEKNSSLNYYSCRGNNFIYTEGEYWRVSDYVGDTITVDRSGLTAEIIRSAGSAFGRFNRILSDMDPMLLKETIPHFHDTPSRLKVLREAFTENPAGRAAACSDLYEEITGYAEFAGTIKRMADSGQLALRVTHNDTKLDNVLFDKNTLDPVTVIDLDTCMPGYFCYDFGDAVRSGCTLSDEDCPESICLDMDLFRAYSEGYMAEMSEVLTEAELESLAYGAPAVTLELAARFLTDFLRGDKYFAINYPNQNLRRSQAQFRLFNGMIEHMNEMKAVILAYGGHIL